MTRLLAFALLAASVPAAAQTVQVAEGDWKHLPPLEYINSNHLDDLMLAGIADVVERGDCELPGQSKRHLDLTVPFAVQYGANGQVERLVLKKLGCTQIEGIVAGALLEMVKGGDFRPTPANSDGWFRGEFSFESKS